MKSIEEKMKQAIDKFNLGQLGGLNPSGPGSLPGIQQGETDE